MKTLEEMVGEIIVMRSIVLDEQKPVTVKLVGVENGNGVWVESQKLTDEFLAEIAEASSSPRGPSSGSYPLLTSPG